MSKMNRRDFIKTTALVGAAAGIMPTALFGASSSKLQVGIIGTLDYRRHYVT